MCRECHELVCPPYTCDKIRVPIDPPNLPASRAERLSGAAYSNRAFKHTRQCCDGSMLCTPKGQVLVHFIRNNRHIMFDAQLGDQAQFLPGKHTATGVLRGVQDQRSRAFAERGAQFIGIKCPGRRMEGHIDRHSVRHQNIWHIRIVKRLDYNHLVSQINQPQYSRENPLGRARSDDHPACHADLQVVETCRVIDNRFAQRRDANTRGILVMLARLQRLDHVRNNIRWRVKVWPPLPQVQRVMLLRQNINFGKNGRPKRCDARSGSGHTTLLLNY